MNTEQEIKERNEAVDIALKEGNMEDLSLLVGIPVEVLQGVQKMTRSERRKWYHDNRKRLGLPRWGQLTKSNFEDNGK